jgi:hypothetical protein
MPALVARELLAAEVLAAGLDELVDVGVLALLQLVLAGRQVGDALLLGA